MHFLRTDFEFGSKEILKMNSVCHVHGINTNVLQYNIRAANKNNRHFQLLTSNKNLQTPTLSLIVNKTTKQ